MGEEGYRCNMSVKIITCGCAIYDFDSGVNSLWQYCNECGEAYRSVVSKTMETKKEEEKKRR